jgi:uncharacterized membrane protein YgcG
MEAAAALSLAVFIVAAIAVIYVYVRRMQTPVGYGVVGVLGFLAAVTPSLRAGDWLTGVGLGVSAALALMLGLRVPYRSGGSPRVRGRVARLDAVQLAELVLVTIALILWVILGKTFAWIPMTLTAGAALLLAYEPLVRRSKP